MPDLWTTNPKKLKGMLQDAGIECGVEARIIKPRETEWTCHVDTNKYIGDIYIHPVWELYKFSPFYSPLIVFTILGIFIGLAWGKRFWRKS